MKHVRLALVASLFFVTAPMLASSARAVHPQLVGVSSVSLNISLENLAGLEAAPLETEIHKELAGAGISVDQSAPQTLFVHVVYQNVPACPDFVAFRTEIALSEEVRVRRGSRTETVLVDTWHESENFVEARVKAAQIAHDSALRFVRYFLDSKAYSESVVKKQ